MSEVTGRRIAAAHAHCLFRNPLPTFWHRLLPIKAGEFPASEVKRSLWPPEMYMADLHCWSPLTVTCSMFQVGRGEREREGSSSLGLAREVTTKKMMEICVLLYLISVPRSTCHWICSLNCHTALLQTGAYFLGRALKTTVWWTVLATGLPKKYLPVTYEMLSFLKEGLSKEYKGQKIPQALLRNTLWPESIVLLLLLHRQIDLWESVGMPFPLTLLFILPTEDMKERGTTEMAQNACLA